MMRASPWWFLVLMACGGSDKTSPCRDGHTRSAAGICEPESTPDPIFDTGIDSGDPPPPVSLALGCIAGTEPLADWSEPDDAALLAAGSDTDPAVTVDADGAWVVLTDAAAWWHDRAGDGSDRALFRLAAFEEGWTDPAICWPLARAISVLQMGGVAGLDAASLDIHKAAMAAACAPDEAARGMEAMLRAAGAGMVQSVFPDLGVDTAWATGMDNAWNQWIVTGDFVENDLGANGRAWFMAMHLADLRDDAAALQGEAFAVALSRYRNTMAPSAQRMASVAEWPFWVAVFERAAFLWDDAGHRWAAHQVRSSALRLGTEAHMAPLFDADIWKPNGLVPKRPLCTSLLTERNTENDGLVADKLVLASSREPGAPFLVVELYEQAAGPMEGSVSWFEFGGTRFIAALPIDRIDPHMLEMESRLLASPQAGVWQHARMPSDRLPAMIPDTPERWLRYLRFQLTNDTDEDLWLTVDNLRLTGPDGEIMVDDFDDRTTLSTGWRAAEFTTDSVQGTHAARLPFEPGTQSHHGGFEAYDVVFDADIHPFIELDWMVPETAEPFPTFLLMGAEGADEAGEGTESNEWFPSAPSISDQRQKVALGLELVTVDHLDGDSHGRIRYADYLQLGSTLVRRMVLTAEGILVVQDVYTPCGDCGPLIAGPSWSLDASTLASASAEALTASGFEAMGEEATAQLGVHFLQTEGHSVGQKEMFSLGGSRQTATGVVAVQPGESTTFLSVLLPTEDGEEGPAVELSDDGVHVGAGEDGVSISVLFGAADEWSVVRADSR